MTVTEFKNDNFYPSAKVLAASENVYGGKIITLEIEFHRFVLAEFNTHRNISKSFQSSRAVPTERLLELVSNSPAIPLYWGKNQPGMTAAEECEETIGGCEMYPGDDRESFWRETAKIASERALAMHEAGYHKQIVNRIIEPYLPVKGVVSGTARAWNDFLKLRDHAAAQPEIRALAIEIKDALSATKFKNLRDGQWHLPYIGEEEEHLTLGDKVITSTSCCAQVSYRRLDKSEETANRVYDRLNLPEAGAFNDDPPHFSPAEHIARATHHNIETSFARGGNFHDIGWFQFRKMLEQGVEENYLTELE